ncbi:MAG: ribosomal protein S18-alanine N-acetyltransferase [Gammaproteobacteria bacterium]|nr:ribosomal protein S18-alanine N-acetyltransferase [Gammaproteobacteria bacterium]
MGAVDVDTVMLVENQVYEHPWTEKIFKDCIRVGYECWLATIDYEIAGYAVLSIAAGESHILNLSVAKPHQGQGIGKHFVQFLVDIARARKAGVIMLEVRPSNVHAIRCYNATGFNEIGSRKGYYPAVHGREDALLLARDIG